MRNVVTELIIGFPAGKRGEINIREQLVLMNLVKLGTPIEIDLSSDEATSRNPDFLYHQTGLKDEIVVYTNRGNAARFFVKIYISQRDA